MTHASPPAGLLDDQPLPLSGAKKLPPIDLLFWLLVISANTIGEAGGDLISMTWLGRNYLLGTLVIFIPLIAAVAFALFVRVQHLSLFWAIVILESTGGTTLSDFFTRTAFGTEQAAAYGKTAAALLAMLVVIFVLWRLVTPNMRMTEVVNRRAELLYWMAILVSSTLGTAFGDWISDDVGLNLGFRDATLVLLGCLAVAAALSFVPKIPAAILFWIGVVITHPLGATMGDYCTKADGFNLGNAVATEVLTAIFLVLVAIEYVRSRGRVRRDVPAAVATIEV